MAISFSFTPDATRNFATRAFAAPPRDAETQLLQEARAGSRVAQGVLLERYRERVTNLAYSLLHSRDDAEDAAQEAFAQAFSSLQSFRGEASFWTWLYRITLNLCLHRKRRSKENCESFDDHELPAHGDAEAEAIARLTVSRTLDALPETLRVALILREMQGLSYEEIARVLAIPEGTVRSRLHEARRRFRELWEDES